MSFPPRPPRLLEGLAAAALSPGRCGVRAGSGAGTWAQGRRRLRGVWLVRKQEADLPEL